MKKVFLCLLTIYLSISALFAEKIESDSLSVKSLQEVEIVSIRANSKTPVAFSNMDKREIEEFNFGQDIPLLLTLTPSVVATSDAGTGIGYTGFRVRGTDANRINITVNGIPLNESESHGVYWVNMPDFASSLQDLQIQRGVGTSTNGAGAFGASVNMKTENSSVQPYGEFSGSYGSFNTSKVNLKLGSGIVRNHWMFDARLSSINSDGFIDRASADLKSYFAQGAYFNENTMLKLVVFGGNEKTYHAWDGVPEDVLKSGNRTYNPSGYMGDDENGNPLYYKNQTDNYQQTHHQLSLLQQLTGHLNLNATLHYTKGLGYYEEYKTGRKFIEYGLQPFLADNNMIKKSDLVRQKHLDNDFYGGIFSLDYAKDKWNVSLGGGGNYYDGNHFGRITWVKNYAFDEHFTPDHEYYRSTGKKTDANLYLKANYQATNHLNLYGDMQYRFINYKIKGENDTWDWINEQMQDLNIHEKFNFFNPKAGFLYQLNKENSFYGSFAVAHREPNRNNYTDAGLNEIPKPERLLDYEAGYKLIRPTFSAGVNFYYMQYKDQLVLTGKVNEIGEPLTSNVPDSYRAGMELILGAKITSWLRWNGNLTLSENKIKKFTEYVDLYDENWEWVGQVENQLKNTPIAFSPNVIIGNLFSFLYKNWDASLQSNFVGKQYLDNTGNNDRSIDSYFVNNLRFGYSFDYKKIKDIKLSLLINNIFNEKYESNGWVYSSYQQITSPEARYAPVRYAEKAYFPQAGTNVLANIVLKF